jgi:hypothetical protein
MYLHTYLYPSLSPPFLARTPLDVTGVASLSVRS